MKLNEASDFFKNLITETSDKSKIKVYKPFLGILLDLKNRNLTEKEFQSIEEELDVLDLKANPEKRKKHLRKKLAEFKKYLEDEFSLVTEGYYTEINIGLGMSLGICFGLALGSAFDTSNGMIIGLVLGMAYGQYRGNAKDSEARKEGRVLRMAV